MPETLLLTPIYGDLSGTVRLETHTGVLKLRVSLTLAAPLPESDVLKLYLLSSKNQAAQPFRAGLVEMLGNSGTLEAEYRKTDVFSPEQYDSIALVEKNAFPEAMFLKAAAFAGDSWDVGAPFGDPQEQLVKKSAEQPHPEPAQQPLVSGQEAPPDTQEIPVDLPLADHEPEQNNPDPSQQLAEVHRLLEELHRNQAYQAFLTLSEEIQNPVERAVEALEAIKELRKTKSDDKNIHLWYQARLQKKLEGFPTVELPVHTAFTWYRIDSPAPLVALSAFEHVLFNPMALRAISRHRHYLLGAHRSKPLYCLALPVAANEPNPLMHIGDCCVFLHSGLPGLDYSTVCVALEEDGQYFLPLEKELEKGEIPNPDNH